MGVPPDAIASNQTGNLILWSTIPPAPSGIFFMRSSIRDGVSAMWLIGTTSLLTNPPPKAGHCPSFDDGVQ